MPSFPLDRRDCLKSLSTFLLAGVGRQWACGAPTGDATEKGAPKRVAAVSTVYRKDSHADVLIGKIVSGWKQDGGSGPALRLASLYVDQFPADDLARSVAHQYDVPLFDTIEGALTLGGGDIAVDGVISIGEHGDYPWNEKEQHLYPRRRFFEQIADTFERCNRVVPVFSDKHLGPSWADAHWMYERAQAMEIPLMAGSSLPLSYRQPEIAIPLGASIDAALGIGYSGLDVYGSHTLDCFQSLVERRVGGERGVESVQCLQGERMWRAVDDGVVRPDLLEAALSVVARQDGASLRKGEGAALFLFQYVDGLLGTVLMLPEFSTGISAALQIKGMRQPLATRFEERKEPRYPHFAFLLKAIERMMHSGRPTYPVERALLTSGILDRALTSRKENGRKLTTPELAIAYQPIDYPHAPQPDLASHPLD